jgi:hypothetical protein
MIDVPVQASRDSVDQGINDLTLASDPFEEGARIAPLCEFWLCR